LQHKRPDEQRIPTAGGLVIDVREELQKVSDSIRVHWKSVSNESDERDWQSEKHDGPRIYTFRGIVIDLREE
jgi:hypothetical protein